MIKEESIFLGDIFAVTHKPLVWADKAMRQAYTDIRDRTPPALINAGKNTRPLWRRG